MRRFRCRFGKNIKWFCIIITILIGFPNFVGCGSSHYLMGLRLLGDAKDYDGAIAEFTKAIESNPKSEGAYWGRGASYYLKGNYDRAIEDYSKAIELNPKYATAYNHRGEAWNRRGDYDHAIEDYNKAIGIDPTYPYAYNNRGNAWKNKGEYEYAIRDYSKAIELNPKLALAYSNRGNAFYCLGKFREAIPDYLKAIENNYQPKDYPYLRLLLASRRVSKEDYERYKKEFSDYVASQKMDEWIREISIYYLEGHKTEFHIINHAQQTGKNQREIKERLCEAYFYLGEYRLMKGDRKGAEEFFRKSMETNIHFFVEYQSSKAMLKLMAEGKI